MPWYEYVAHFLGAAFLANALPHLIAGVSGRQFHTPFASPPFRGLSSPGVNVAWALVNLGAAWFLLARIGTFDIRTWPSAAAAFAGFGLMAFQVTRSLARMQR